MNGTDPRRTLRTGAPAYFDSMRCGLVPCRVLSVEGFPGRPSTAQTVRVQFTGTRGAFKRGETWITTGLHAVPRAAIIRRRYSTSIGFYVVECDSDKVTAAPAFALVAR